MGKIVDADELYAAFRRDIMGGLNWDRILKEAKPVDAVPVRHGKWERHYSSANVYADLYWHCSACGGKKADSWADKYKFCPDCGARMDGKDGDGNG